MVVNVNTELRKLRPAELYNLGLLLNPSDNWKKLMASVTKDGTDDIPKFPGEYISIVEQAARQERKLAAAVFLEEWATMGRERPTVGLLLDLLMKTELFRAADYLARDIMKVATPQRPATGPAAPVDINEITNLLLHQNLEPESASNDSDFCLRTTTEIRLSQFNYPISLFDNETNTNDKNLAVDDDVGVIEMQYAESRSNQVLEPGRPLLNPKSSNDDQSHAEILKNIDSSKSCKEISDLMKFSASDSQNLGQYSRSDIHEAIMPDLHLLCRNSSSKRDSNGNPDYVVASNAEITSAELPACLEKFGASDEPPASVDKIVGRDNLYYHRELVSAELPLCLKNRIGFNSGEGNLSVKFRSDGDDSFPGNSSNFSSESLDDRSSSESFEIKSKDDVHSVAKIACSVVEAGRRERTEEKEEAVEYEPGKYALNSQELPITVLELHKR